VLGHGTPDWRRDQKVCLDDNGKHRTGCSMRVKCCVVGLGGDESAKMPNRRRAGSSYTRVVRSHIDRETNADRLELLQGTLDLMVLQTLAGMGSLHGYGIARRIEQVSGDQILLNQGTIYASLVRLQQRGWIAAEWGISDNNRKAKFYAITKNGRRQLASDVAHWEKLAAVIGRVLAMAGRGEKP